MEIKCPHCGTEYDAEESEYGRFVKCEICGKGFVVGTSRRNLEMATPTPGKKNTDAEKKNQGRSAPDTTTSPRQIKIYGYREWFIGRNPVRVFVGSSKTPLCEVPPDGVVTITVKVKDTLSFIWDGPMGWFQRKFQLVVGDCKNVVLSFGNRRDWPLCATATDDVESILKPIVRSNAHMKKFVLPIGIAVLVVFAVYAFRNGHETLTLWKEHWRKALFFGLLFSVFQILELKNPQALKLTDGQLKRFLGIAGKIVLSCVAIWLFFKVSGSGLRYIIAENSRPEEVTHYVVLEKYIDTRSETEKELIRSWEKQNGLAFRTYFRDCPHCGGKCDKPQGRLFPKQNAETKAMIKYTYICPWCHMDFRTNP